MRRKVNPAPCRGLAGGTPRSLAAGCPSAARFLTAANPAFYDRLAVVCEDAAISRGLRVMRRTTLWAATLWLAGCATTTTARPGPAAEMATTSDKDSATPPSELARLTKAF